MGAYLGILVLVLVAALVCGLMVVASWVLGPKRITPYKSSPYECGVAPVGDARERFPIKFYVVAILFILFDIEVVFLWSWMTAFHPAGGTADRSFMAFSYLEVLAYMVTWVVGYVYAIKCGAIDWDETLSLPSAQADGLPVDRHTEIGGAA